MKSWRFFVTSAFILATAAILACTSKTEKRSAQVAEGNQQIRAAAAVQSDLELNFKLSLGDARFEWNKLSRSQRQTVKEKLAEYVAAVTRTFEIDAKKGLYLTKKEILQKQLDGAMALQKSLETFERTYGENFEPQKPKDHA